MKLTGEQITVIKCAYADLVGARQAFEQDDIHVHNWNAHNETIEEMEDAFDFLDKEKPLEI